MKAISLKRKQRIAEVRKQKVRARNKKMAAVTIAGTISALVLLNGKAAAYGKDYTVKKRDTLYSLSKKYQVSIDQLKETNALTSEKIVVGQRLVLPEQGKTMVPKSEEITNQYTVQKGDSLFLLAKKYGITLEKLKKINNIQSDRINIGQKIVSAFGNI
ncbi:LysM peptidoglycan-binding domain-containing protein [Neobacillus sp. PS3-34]|uniref:LysM peptidoglycan-binding domain-containing protein n=1 Tax=Neobacillus sp. PS3-34 TaxID=3070678 RepID=UPI0027DF995B|nr:LysM peptidoglycan-binding domain-containing protein [Neobacillus sp. PS3-34]WML46645.1 LysM peptidoglycan-binding domain-containing protein [Neobacillus sp. PS3-34]